MKISLNTLLLITITFISTSCSNNDNSSMEWDIYPFELNIVVVNEQGDNLMNPLVENNLTQSGITAHFAPLS